MRPGSTARYRGTTPSVSGYRDVSHRGGAARDAETHVLLRNHFYHEAIRFSKGTPGSCYDVFLNAPYPTDPGVTCTVPFKVPELPDIANTQPPRFRWSTLVPLFMVLVCDGIRSGIALALAAESVHTLRISFYVMCLVVWAFLAVPVVQLQHALAQFFQGGPLRTCGLLHPRLWGLGLALLSLLLFRSPLLLQNVGESLLYLGDSAAKRLPWRISPEVERYCASQWGKPVPPSGVTDYCVDVLNNSSWVPNTLTPIEAFFKEKIRMVSPTPKIYFHAEFALACFIGACVVFIIIVAGVRFLGKVAAFTVITLLFLLTMLTLNIFQIRGALEALGLLTRHFDASCLYSVSAWIDVLFLMLRISSVIAGQHCIMPSYTRVGTNVLYVAWVAGLASILVSAWTVILVYAYQGSVFAATIETTFRTVYIRSGMQDQAKLNELVAEQVEKALTSSLFEQFIVRGLTQKFLHQFLYILFPWAVGRQAGGQMFLIVFYFCLTLTATVSLAGVVLALVSGIREVARFELTHPTYIKVFFYFILLALTFPSFFPFYIDTPFGKESFGRYFTLTLWMSSFNLGCPIAGLCFLFATLFVLGYEKQAEILPRYAVILHWCFMVAGFTYTFYCVMHSTRSIQKWIGVAVGLVAAVGSPFILALCGRTSYRCNLCSLLLGDVEAVRLLLNKVMFGCNCKFRLRRSWGIALKYGCVIWFLFVLTTSRPFRNTYWEVDSTVSTMLALKMASDITVAACVVLPIVVLAIFPKAGRCFYPSPANQWKIKDVVKKTDPKRGFKRFSVKFWEEYWSPQTVWSLADTVTYGKL